MQTPLNHAEQDLLDYADNKVNPDREKLKQLIRRVRQSGMTESAEIADKTLIENGEALNGLKIKTAILTEANKLI